MYKNSIRLSALEEYTHMVYSHPFGLAAGHRILCMSVCAWLLRWFKTNLCFQMLLPAICFSFLQKAARGPLPFVRQKLSCKFVRDGCLFYIYLIFCFCICGLYICSIGDETFAHNSCLGLVSFRSYLSELLEIYSCKVKVEASVVVLPWSNQFTHWKALLGSQCSRNSNICIMCPTLNNLLFSPCKWT